MLRKPICPSPFNAAYRLCRVALLATVFTAACFPISAGAQDWSDESNQADAELGWSVAGAGDINGDGFEDLLVGAPYYDNGQTDAGRAFLYLGSGSGLGSSPAWSAEGDQTGAWFGQRVAAAGDVNGDGYDDVLVAAPGYDGGETDEGKVFLFLGGKTGLSASASWTAEGDQNGARFGSGLAGQGDVNNDQFADVFIGAPYYDPSSFPNSDRGRVSVYHGSPTGLPSSANTVLDGSHDHYFLGSSVSSAGDFNGDSYTDLMIGAPHALNSDETVGSGVTKLYFGSPFGILASFPLTVSDPQAEIYLGTGVASAGDVNADGFDDVVSGAPGADVFADENGAAFVSMGSANPLATTQTVVINGGPAYAQLGFAVAGAGDVNGDGFADVLIGAWGHTGDKPREGEIRIHYGSPLGLLLTTAWAAEGDQGHAELGCSVSSGDFNGDGHSDIVAGAWGYDNGESNEGRVLVWYGSPTGP